eukprot:1157922-Pelagomonas_calceolata.AAC.6
MDASALPALTPADINAVLQCLTTALSPAQGANKHAEAVLASLEQRPGFCSCLAEIIGGRAAHDYRLGMAVWSVFEIEHSQRPACRNEAKVPSALGPHGKQRNYCVSLPSVSVMIPLLFSMSTGAANYVRHHLVLDSANHMILISGLPLVRQNIFPSERWLYLTVNVLCRARHTLSRGSKLMVFHAVQIARQNIAHGGWRLYAAKTHVALPAKKKQDVPCVCTCSARWLASVHLKNTVVRHWRSKAERSGLSPQERAHLRAVMLGLIDQEDNQIAIQGALDAYEYRVVVPNYLVLGGGAVFDEPMNKCVGERAGLLRWE